jgi:hypothetical protein
MSPNDTSGIDSDMDATKGQLEEARARIAALREAAKQIASLTSVLPALYFASVSFSDIHNVVHGPETLPFVLPVIPWLLSLALIGHIVIPYRVPDEDIKKRLERAVKLIERYRSEVQWAYIGLIAGLIWAMIELGYYLWYVPAPTK